jgi:hypothetical protein
MPPNPISTRAVPPAALDVWPWSTTKFAGSPVIWNGGPSGEETPKGPRPELCRKATMDDTRPSETAASMTRSRAASPIGRSSERVNAMFAGCRWYDYTGEGLVHTLGCWAARPRIRVYSPGADKGVGVNKARQKDPCLLRVCGEQRNGYQAAYIDVGGGLGMEAMTGFVTRSLRLDKS